MDIQTLTFNEQALLFAKCSQIAYYKETLGKQSARELGFDNISYFSHDEAQGYIFKTDTDIVIALRGTEPSKINDIIADLKVWRTSLPGDQEVHAGFLEEVDDIWYPTYKKFLEYFHNNKGMNVWITGHSLGGAMGTIFAQRLCIRDHADHITMFTYGSPRVGNRAFGRKITCDHYRFVNNNDIVPRLPTPFFGYKHHGILMYMNFNGDYAKLTFWQKTKDHLRGRWTALVSFKWFDGARDHSITSYLNNLKNK